MNLTTLVVRHQSHFLMKVSRLRCFSAEPPDLLWPERCDRLGATFVGVSRLWTLRRLACLVGVALSFAPVSMPLSPLLAFTTASNS